MADTRPRPRPRPRPVQKPSTAASSSSSNIQTVLFKAGSSSPGKHSDATTIPLSSSNGAANRVIVVEDTDEMFLRNRNRSSKAWKKLEELDKKSKISEIDLSGSEEDEDEGKDLTPRRRKRIKKDNVPVWHKSQELARMLSQEISDSSDSNDIVEIFSTPKKQRNGKRKRLRSRSRSITPPPALSDHHIQNAKRIVRQTLEAALPAIRLPSPTVLDLDLDDSTDSSLQPEFKALVQRVRNESKSGSTQHIPDAAPGEELLLIVKWHPHPLATNATDEEWQYKVDKTDDFRDLFEAVAEDAGVPQANVILTYQGKRFYPSVTPTILRIWSDSAEFNGYEKTAYGYIQENQQKSMFSQPSPSPGPKRTLSEPIDIDSDFEDIIDIPRGSFRASTPPRSQTQTHDSDSDLGKTLKLVLRSALTGSKEITLTVRTTTRCDAVVKAFIKKAGLGQEKYPELFAEQGNKKGRKSAAGTGKDPRLSVDGDKFGNNTLISQTDLEDGDMVEVVGL